MLTQFLFFEGKCSVVRSAEIQKSEWTSKASSLYGSPTEYGPQFAHDNRIETASHKMVFLSAAPGIFQWIQVNFGRKLAVLLNSGLTKVAGGEATC